GDEQVRARGMREDGERLGVALRRGPLALTGRLEADRAVAEDARCPGEIGMACALAAGRGWRVCRRSVTHGCSQGRLGRSLHTVTEPSLGVRDERKDSLDLVAVLRT